MGAGVVLWLAACTPHPVGPARTLDDYERKAGTTAESALSAVETVQLVAGAAADGKSFGPYASVVVSEQEDAVSGLAGTFGSVQPPGADADAVRDELDRLLSAALAHVTDVRLAVRRGELGDLDRVASALADDADELERFVEEHT